MGSDRAPPQGGILDGGNPSHYDPQNPIILFIIQAGIIIILCRLLHYPLSKIRQPRVIAEVIGGILLGPSVLGHIPGFKDAIFPNESIPTLNLAANLGLVLFLFLVGVETDLRFLIRNWRVALSVSAAGMVLPFGLGCGIAYGLYHEFREEPGLAPISFGTYMLFIGVAMAITAFPVLCRILTELKLLGTNVGVIVLSAGVGNDIVGWILLALCVALVNAGSGLTALWVLLVCLGYALFLAYAVRPGFMWFLKRTNSLQKGPDQSVVALTLLMALASAFFTQIIGVHAIFGAFMVGLICPHEGGFAIKLTEKIEDLVGALFLPLYFAYSGLNTNIGLLDNGITWAYVIGVIVVAFVAKVVGGTLASRLNGLVWRESLTIGVLMSCKGLVELIVLNIGLQAKILSQRTFTVFVVMALVTTCITTPLTSYLYPDWYQRKGERWRRGEIDWDGHALTADTDACSSAIAHEKLQASSVRKLLVYLRFDSLPSLLTFISLLRAADSESLALRVHHRQRDDTAATQTKDNLGAAAEAGRVTRNRVLQVHGVRLVELTDRDSSVMKMSEIEEYTVRDPVVNTFRTFGQLNNVAVSGDVAVVPEHSYADAIVSKAHEMKPDLVLIPWSETGRLSERHNLFSGDSAEEFASNPHSAFIMNALKSATSNVGIFVNRGFGGPFPDQKEQYHRPALGRSTSAMSIRSLHDTATLTVIDRSHHIFLPYFGGTDDHFALRFVMQLAQDETITATIVYFDLPCPSESTILPLTDAQRRREVDTATFTSIRDSCPPGLASRVVFQTDTQPAAAIDSTSPMSTILAAAREEVGCMRGNAGDLVVVGRGSFNVGGRVETGGYFPTSPSEEVGIRARWSLGVLAQAMLHKSNGVKASVLVIQAAGGRGAVEQ